MTVQLSIAQQSRLRTLIRQRAHPVRIDDFLKSCGVDEAALDGAYAELNLRRSHVLACYKMKRNARWVGALVILASVAVPVLGDGQMVIMISLGLFVYGVVLVVTGNPMGEEAGQPWPAGGVPLAAGR